MRRIVSHAAAKKWGLAPQSDNSGATCSLDPGPCNVRAGVWCFILFVALVCVLFVREQFPTSSPDPAVVQQDLNLEQSHEPWSGPERPLETHHFSDGAHPHVSTDHMEFDLSEVEAIVNDRRTWIDGLM